MSEIISHCYSEDINLDELNYREQIQPFEKKYSNINNWFKEITIKVEIMSALFNHVEFKGSILELGAGSGWFGSELSKLESVNKVYCLDLSKYLLENITPQIIKFLNAKEEKITRVIGDFNNLQFNDLDFVVFDSAMHHIPEEIFNNVLLEIHRTLKDNGKVVSIFEPFLGNNNLVNFLRKRQFGRHERKFGVTENIFSKEQWQQKFEDAGFKANFISHFHDSEQGIIKKILKKMFKETFPEYIIVLEKI